MVDAEQIFWIMTSPSLINSFHPKDKYRRLMSGQQFVIELCQILHGVSSRANNIIVEGPITVLKLRNYCED